VEPVPARLRDDEPGTRLSNLDYAPLAEIMGRVPWASEVFNCNAPDTGNMELLHLFATPAQYERWLEPLLAGEIRSCFAMTEPDVASSDPTNIQTRIRRDGDDWVINGRKWFITGAAHPTAGWRSCWRVSDRRRRAAHARHSMVLVPMDTPGLTVVRNIPVMNHQRPRATASWCSATCACRRRTCWARRGRASRWPRRGWGPGRIHHCMRSIGQCELALELMCERALERRAFGRYLADYANVQDWIAESRIEIDQARLLVLQGRLDARPLRQQGRGAHRRVGDQGGGSRLQTRVLDRAMQVFGAMGLTPDTPLAAVDLGPRACASRRAGRGAPAHRGPRGWRAWRAAFPWLGAPRRVSPRQASAFLVATRKAPKKRRTKLCVHQRHACPSPVRRPRLSGSNTLPLTTEVTQATVPLTRPPSAWRCRRAQGWLSAGVGGSVLRR
jgi:acyl-CoA dehydrogenase